MIIPGSYRLFSYYAVRSSYFINNLQIDTMTTTPTNWKLYSYFVYPILGTKPNLFNGQDDSNNRDIALTNIQFHYIPNPECHTLQHKNI